MNTARSAPRHRWSALALLTAACGPAPDGAANAGAVVAPTATASAASGELAACRARADGDAPALRACADRELARLSAALPGHERAAQDYAAALRALGDDALSRGVFGAGEAASVAVADAAVAMTHARAAWLAGGTAPAGRIDPAVLGTPARAAWTKSRASTCAAFAPADCAARYDALLAPYVTPSEPARMIAADNAQTPGLPLPDCAAVKATGLIGGALGDAFYQRYPKVLADPATVDGVALDDAAIGNIVEYLACVAALTDGDPVVADNAAALFDSPRHGRAAFARLAATPNAARFLAQMKSYR
jgi:hypothetical protein